MAAQTMAEMAAFEAVGHAKFTGRIGFCTATSGPGAIHLLNGLYDAKLDHVAVVAIVGQTNRSAMGGSYHAAGVAARHVRADRGRRIGSDTRRRGPLGRDQAGHRNQAPGIPAAPKGRSGARVAPPGAVGDHRTDCQTFPAEKWSH